MLSYTQSGRGRLLLYYEFLVLAENYRWAIDSALLGLLLLFCSLAGRNRLKKFFWEQAGILFWLFVNC